jgi:hypothetical protein
MLHFLLEPDALRGARPVLRGGGGSNAISLPDEQHAWQVGEFEPLYALELDPDEPDSFTTLKSALEACKRMVELTQELYTTLEVSTCLFP